MSTPSLRSSFQLGVVWAALQRWGQSGIGFVVFLVLARLLDPADFGLVALAGALIAFLRVFIDQGFSSAIIQRDGELEPRYLDTAFWITIIAGLVLAGSLVLAAGPVARLFGEPRLAPVAAWMALMFVFTGLSVVQEALLRRRFAFKKLAVRQLVGVSLGGVVGLAMAFAGFGVWSLVARYLVESVVTTAMLWWVSDWRPGRALSLRHLRELTGFGAPILGANFLLALERQVDQLLIGYLFNAQVLGVYTVARTLLANVADLVNGVALQVGLPTFSRMQAEPARALAALHKITRAAGLVLFPVLAGIVVMAPEVVLVLFGTGWAGAAPVMQILAFLILLQCLTSWSTVVMTAFRRPGWRLGVTALNAVTNAAAVALAAPFGLVAVALAVTLRAYLILPPVHALLMRRLVDLRVMGYLRQLAVPGLATLIMAAGVLSARHLLPEVTPLVLLAACGGLGATLYAGALAVLDPGLVRQLWQGGRTALQRPFARSRSAV